MLKMPQNYRSDSCLGGLKWLKAVGRRLPPVPRMLLFIESAWNTGNTGITCHYRLFYKTLHNKYYATYVNICLSLQRKQILYGVNKAPGGSKFLGGTRRMRFLPSVI